MRYYSKEHNRLMLSPKKSKPKWNVIGTTASRNAKYVKDMEAYNTWLSSSLEIVGEHNWKDEQEVREYFDYEVKERWKPIQEANDRIIYQPMLVAIPKKEKDFEPSNSNPDLDSVASHSSTSLSLLDKWALQNIVDAEQEFKNETNPECKQFLNGVIAALQDTRAKIEQLMISDKNAQVSDTTEADSSNPV